MTDGFRRIIHLDMDAFYASVEQQDRAELRGQPVIVGGSAERGVVCACSYETRPFGVCSGMAMARALQLCPQARVLPVRMGRYQQVSEEVFAVFERYTDRIERLSIDEGFLDVTGSERLFGSALEIARKIRCEVRETTGLAVSAGVAHNKFLAKLASELSKPDGLLAIHPDQVDDLLVPLPIGRIWGIGKVTAKRLESRGLQTIGDLRSLSEEHLVRLCGKAGRQIYHLARGEDARPVVPGEGIKSIGAEETFARDLWASAELTRELLALSERVGRRLRRKALAGRCVTLKVKYADFSSISRSQTLSAGVDNAAEIYRQVTGLLTKTEAERRAVRLLGVSISQLEPKGSGQGDLFGGEDRARQAALDRAVDQLWERYGDKGVSRATLVKGRGQGSPGKKGRDPGQGS